jgi:hypothetical protein
MKDAVLQRSLACLLILCILAVGGLAAAQSLTHETQHSHHQKATHSSVLCSWMCAAGQVLDTTVGPSLVERTPVALAEFSTPQALSSVPSSLIPSRGPPAQTAI